MDADEPVNLLVRVEEVGEAEVLEDPGVLPHACEPDSEQKGGRGEQRQDASDGAARIFRRAHVGIRPASSGRVTTAGGSRTPRLSARSRPSTPTGSRCRQRPVPNLASTRGNCRTCQGLAEVLIVRLLDASGWRLVSIASEDHVGSSCHGFMVCLWRCASLSTNGCDQQADDRPVH